MARVSRKNRTGQGSNDNQKALYKAGIYLRLSKVNNGKDNDESIENQENLILKFLESVQDVSVTEIYCENGHTGTVFDRPVFNGMIDDLSAGKINCVVVKDLSRFGRNSLDATDYLTNIFPQMNVRFISVRDRYDSLYDDAGKSQLNLVIENFINELYAKDISRKSSTVLRSKRKRGLFVGMYAPYGYMKDENDKNKLVVDKEAASVVRMIFEWRAAGEGYGKIYDRLNSMHIPSPSYYRYIHGIVTNINSDGREYPWSRHMIKIILENQIYIGDMVQGKQLSSFYKNEKIGPIEKDKWIIVPNTHEPIISRELYEAAQNVNDKRKKAFEKDVNKFEDRFEKVSNAYSGVIYCADCGYSMKLVRSISKKKDKVYYVFKCANFMNHGKTFCSPKKIKLADMDEVALKMINLHVSLFTDRKRELEKLNSSPQIRYKTEQIQRLIDELSAREAKVKRNKSTLYFDYKDGLLDYSEYGSMRVDYNKQLEQIHIEKERLAKAVKTRQREISTGSLWEKASASNNEVTEVTKELIKTYIERIEVTDESHIKMTFRNRNEFKELEDAIDERRKEIA